MVPVKRARIASGHLAREVAEALDITPQYLSEIENGRVPSFNLARKMAAFYGTTVDRLFPARNVNGELKRTFEEEAAAASGP